MARMTVKKALQVCSEAAYLRAGLWESSIDDNLFSGNELECFLEADDDERAAMAAIMQEAHEVVTDFLKDYATMIESLVNREQGRTPPPTTEDA